MRLHPLGISTQTTDDENIRQEETIPFNNRNNSDNNNQYYNIKIHQTNTYENPINSENTENLKLRGNV